MPRYDVAVAGAGVGGLAAAALLARNNKRTIVVDPADTVGGALASVRKDGFVFSTGPNLSFGFERGGALQGLCADLGISQNAAVLSPCYQVALPDRRISVFRETGETLEELRREFPREIDAITRFYRDLRAMAERNAKSRFSAYRFRRRKAGPHLQGYRFSRELRTFLDIPSLYFFQQPAADLPLSSLITLFDTSPLAVHDGFKQLCEQILSSILKNGGEIRHGQPRLDIAHKGGQAYGLLLPEGPVIEATTVLMNTPSFPRCTTVFIGMREEVVPLGMSQEVLCLPDYDHREWFFSLSVGSRDSEAAPRGMRAVTATFPFIHRGKERPGAFMNRIERLIPFLDKFLVTAGEYKPEAAEYALPSDTVLKPLSDALGVSLLSRTSLKQLYVLPDDPQSPLRAVSAARRLAGILL